ncbi:MAG TPA: hypothetical protein VFG59_08085 [Anaeromyxobacter sp.]|nr:hypothetical protein [Anaeromyxobacter sp.]
MLRLSALALAVALGASSLESIPLRWKPTDKSPGLYTDAARTFGSRTVTVNPFTDTREDKALIGRNIERSTPKLVTTRDDVGAFCAARIGDLLRQGGVRVVPEGGEVVVDGEVSRYHVEEENTYEGDVILKLRVSAGGKEVWTGVVAGHASRFGRSYKEENYMETLSDSLMRAVEEFVSDSKLASAIK